MPAPDVIATFLAGMRDAIRLIDGAGNYNFDLTDTDDRCRIMWTPVPQITGLSVQIWGIGPSGGEQGPTLGNFQRNPVVILQGWADGTDGTGENRLFRAARLFEDVTEALKATFLPAATGIRDAVIPSAFEIFTVNPEGGLSFGYFRMEVTVTFTHFPCT